MKSLLSCVLTAGLLAAPAAWADPGPSPAEPEVFPFRVQVSLTRLTPHPGIPGVVDAEIIPGSGIETADVKLDQCQPIFGKMSCSGDWSKVIRYGDTNFLYYVNIYNQENSPDHTFVVIVCTSGETKIGDCRRWFAQQVHFDGREPPGLEMYDSTHWNGDTGSPAFLQPGIRFGKSIRPLR